MIFNSDFHTDTVIHIPANRHQLYTHLYNCTDIQVMCRQMEDTKTAHIIQRISNKL